MFRADTHCHTTFSDGSLNPLELVQKARAEGLSALSFTDHDDADAYLMAREHADQLGFALAPGVELSCLEEGESIHILGYGFEIPPMQAILADYKRLRAERNCQMLAKLASLGMPIALEELPSSQGSLGRPHIALKMMEKGYVCSFREAFEKWIGDGKPAFAQVARPSVQEGIAHIHSCKGLAVLAHPHLVRPAHLFNQLLRYAFDGIEGYYGDFSTDRFAKIGKERGWLVTGGSDFHGVGKRNERLGSSWSDEETFCRLQEGKR